MPDAYVVILRGESPVEDDEPGPHMCVVGPFDSYADAKAFAVRDEVVDFCQATNEVMHCWVTAGIVAEQTSTTADKWLTLLQEEDDDNEGPWSQ